MKTVLVLMSVAIIMSAGAIVYVFYDNRIAHSGTGALTVEVGDEVLMDYIGMFEDGRVFDTSIYEVASNDNLYPKAFSFSMRGDASAYTPFQMTAGLYEGEGATIKGFAMGVIGLSEGDQSTITVVPGEGYELDETKLETIPLVETVTATETMSESDFLSLFGVSAEPLGIATHYKWGYDVIVNSVEAGMVTLKHIPTVGETVYPFGDPSDETTPMGWACEVVGYDPEADGGIGEVTVRHMVTQSDVYMLEGTTYDGTTFIVWSMDTEAGTFVIHKNDSDTGYNAELAGRTLLFEVSIIYITR